MTEISAVMRAYRDALDRHRIPWADDTYDTVPVGGYRTRIERTKTILDEHEVSVIWGYQCLPVDEPDDSAGDGEETEMKVRTVGITYGYPDYLEVMYDPISADPFVAAPGDILAEVFGVRGGSRWATGAARPTGSTSPSAGSRTPRGRSVSATGCDRGATSARSCAKRGDASTGR